MNNNNNNMDKPRKFVYSTGSTSKKQKSSSEPFSWHVNDASRCARESSDSMPQVQQVSKDEVDDFKLGLDFDDDDITSTMSAADLDRLELEASEKFGLLEASAAKACSFDTERKQVEPKNLVSVVNNQGSSRKATPPTVGKGKSPQKVRSLDGCQTGWTGSQTGWKGSQTGWTGSAPASAEHAQMQQQQSTELEGFKLRVCELESRMCERDGELKILRSSLEEKRKESAEKSERLVQFKNHQRAEQSQREASLEKEVVSLQTKLSFQEQELQVMEQSKRTQSQRKTVTGGIKRKAELGTLNSSFHLDNSFIATQQMSSKKIPRVSEMTGFIKNEPALKSTTCPVKKESTDKPVDLPNMPQVKNDFVCTLERKGFQLVKNLILTHSSDYIGDGDEDAADTISLLSLLKYPLKHLPEVLKAHSVNTCAAEASEFPLWQSQTLHACPVGDNCTDADVMDLDSGKYSLVTQGVFILLGLYERGSPEGTDNPYEQVSPSLGVTHILVFLELYISSFLFTRESMASGDVDKSDVGSPGPSRNEHLKNDTEWQKSFIDNHEMIVLALQVLKLLLYSVPSLVKLVLERTDASVFTSSNDDIVIDDDSGDKPEEVKDTAGPSAGTRLVPGCSSSNDCSTQERLGIYRNVDAVEGEFSTDDLSLGSFLSLLLQNLEKLIIPYSDESLTVSYAALDVLVTMTSFCEKKELERIFLLLKRGCLFQLLAKDSGRLTVLSVMLLLKNLLPCKDIHKMLCSRTDDCILLKIYQCACKEDEDEDISDMMCRHFLLQTVKFLKSVAISHSDSIEFLLETDCQCSLEVTANLVPRAFAAGRDVGELEGPGDEIIRCLILILHDKVNYLLGLDPDIVTSDESLTILRIGITLLVILCTHSSYSLEHKLDVEHHYIELIYNVMILYKNIKDFIPEVEALGVQDLLDMDQIDEIEWPLGSDDEDEEIMEIDA